MINATVQSRILNLLRQSRQASRLYASVRHLDASPMSQLAKVQSEEWRIANEQLCKKLGNVLRSPASSTTSTVNGLPNTSVNKPLGQELNEIRDEVREAWREAERELHLRHLQLARATEQADYVAAVMLAKELVRWKARKEAQNAVYEELTQLLRSCRLNINKKVSPNDTGLPQLEENQDVLVTEAATNKQAATDKHSIEHHTSSQSITPNVIKFTR